MHRFSLHLSSLLSRVVLICVFFVGATAASTATSFVELTVADCYDYAEGYADGRCSGGCNDYEYLQYYQTGYAICESRGGGGMEPDPAPND